MGLKIAAILTAHEGLESQLEGLLRGMVSPSRAEPGVLRFDLWKAWGHVERFLLDELYVDNAAIEAHRASPHFAEFVSRIGALADRDLLLAYPVDVIE